MKPTSALQRPSRTALCLVILTVPAAWADRPMSATSLEPITSENWDRAAAAHLLRRACFGGSYSDIERLFALGPEAAIDAVLRGEAVPTGLAPPSLGVELLETPERAELRLMDLEQRQRYRRERAVAERRAFDDLKSWWLRRMVQTPHPFEERMTLFWHGHFTSGMREVKRAAFLKEQNELLRKAGLGRFSDLLLRISQDRAMLAYLDGNRNVRRAPNENFARELLELFSLGEGNYTERDVRMAARAFTGWGFDQSGFQFRPQLHDAGEKVFLGKKGRFGGQEIIRALLEHPECARLVANKLLTAFVRPDPDRRLVEALAAWLRKNNFDLRGAMRVLLRSQAFYHPEARGALVKSPVELLVGTARSLETGVADIRAAQRALIQMGQELFQPPSVRGWPGGEKWINTSTLFVRYNVVGGLIHGQTFRDANRAGSDRDVASTAEATNDETPMRDTGASARQPTYDPITPLRSLGLRSAEQIVEHYQSLLLAVPLSSEKSDALVRYLRAGGEFNLDAPEAAKRVRNMLHLLCSTPEYQLN